MLLLASSAVTVTLNAVPAGAEAGAVTTRVLAAAGLTVTGADEPVIVEVTVSVAVTVWLPAVFRVRPVKVCTPASAAVKV